MLKLTLLSKNVRQEVSVSVDTGEVLSRVSQEPLAEPPIFLDQGVLVAVAGECLLAIHEDDLVAMRTDGHVRWRRSLDDVLQPTADDRVTALVPYARSIFGLTASGTLFRLAP